MDCEKRETQMSITTLSQGICILALLATSTLLISLPPTPAQAEVLASGCKVDAQSFAGTRKEGAANAFVTTSQTFVDIPETAVTFTTEGAVADCLVIHFVASVEPPSGILYVRPLLDGSIRGFPDKLKVGKNAEFE